jgi:hypothetical protein
MKFFRIVFSLLIIVSCEKNQRKIDQKPTTQVALETPKYVKDLDDINKTYNLLNNAINTGNEKAYNDVAGSYILGEKYDELLYYSIIMANKHNSSEAYYHVFLILTKDDFNKLDKKTKNLALFFLVKSNELGYESAKYSLKEIFGETKILPSNYYITEYAK